MSLDPFWFSTIFGAYYFAGSFVAAIALLTVIACRAATSRGLFGALSPGSTLHNLGKLLLAFIAFWAYIAFSQYMLIWIANIPEEACLVRGAHEGRLGERSGILLVVGHFVVPFFALLSRAAEVQPARLASVGGVDPGDALGRSVLAGACPALHARGPLLALDRPHRVHGRGRGGARLRRLPAARPLHRPGARTRTWTSR